MQINKSIFREYDIRGIAGDKFDPELVKEYEKWYGPFPGITITPEASKAIGKGYGTIIKRNGGKEVVVGYEMRPFADLIKESFISGIIETGVNVTDLDKTTTPFVYFMNAYKEYDGGVNITGSHNVYFYNGFKMMKKGNIPLYGEELKEMAEMIEKETYDISETKGTVTKMDNVYQIYKDYVLSHVKLSKKLKVVIDCGNGTPGLFIVDLLESLGCEVLEGMYLNPDPYFPNHIPDPESPKNLKELMEKVKELKADIGLALDADGDRAGFIDEKGQFVFADDILLLLARDVLKRHPGKKILFDVKSTQLLEDLVPTFGGIPLMHKTGHAPIKDTILRKDRDVILGGEVSGHQFFVENYFGIDDGPYSMTQVLKLLSETDKTLSELIAEFPRKVRTPELKLPCVDEIKFDVIKRIKEEFAGKYKAVEIDGIRIQFDETSWGLVRASNTSPYLTIRVEGDTEEQVLKIKNILADVLDNISEIKDKLNRNEVASLTGTLGFV